MSYYRDDYSDDDYDEYDLSYSFGSLTMKPAITLSSRVLMYSAWVSQPKPSFLASTHREDILLDILRKFMKIGIGHHEIATLKKKEALPSVIQITSYIKTIPPEPKPNMLLVVASLFSHHQKQSTATVSVKSLLASLSKYDVIVPRKPLQKILSLTNEEFETYVFRPTKESPLFIDRTSSYSTNPGTIGIQFEGMIVNPPKAELHRTYGLFQVELSNLKLMVTGEVDGINLQSGNPIEIKTKPGWAHPDQNRLRQNWAQCAIGNVDTVVTGSFTAARYVKRGPVTFNTSRDIVYESFSQFASKVHDKEKGAANALDILKQILTTCSEVGVVYRVSVSSHARIRCVKVPKGNYDFPISQETIEMIADLAASGNY